MNEALVVYTVILGDYDTLRAPRVRDEGVRYVCITDREPSMTKGWEVRLVETTAPLHPFAQRTYKILSHQVFPQADVTLYVDGNLELLASPTQLAEEYLAETDLAVFRHPERDGIYAEIQACATLGKDRRALLEATEARYRRWGVPETGLLYAGGMLLRRHSKVISEFNETWLRELRASTIRDQPPLGYVLWKTAVAPAVIDKDIRNNDLVAYHPHKNKTLSTDHDFLFICGNPRSGTSALCDLLNADSRIIVGMERFRRIRKKLTPRHFSRSRFFTPTPRETNFLPERLIPPDRTGFRIWPRDEDRVKQKWDSPELAYVGDKAPFYVRQLPYLREAFPGSRFIVLLRDPVSVADSYQRRADDPEDHWPVENDYSLGVEHWNQSIADVLDYIETFGLEDLFLVDHDMFYSGDVTYLRSLYRFLELDPQAEVLAQFSEMTRGWRPRITPPRRLTKTMVQRVRAEADWEGYARVRQALPLMRDYRLLATGRDARSVRLARLEAQEARYRELIDLSRTLYASLRSLEEDGSSSDANTTHLMEEVDLLWQSYWSISELGTADSSFR